MSASLLSALPTINAVLNGTSAVLLVVGFLFIRRRRITAHKIYMLSAFVTSIVFLISYLTLRYFAGFTSFPGQGWIRPLYFTILISHTVLTATVPPLPSSSSTARFGRSSRSTGPWPAGRSPCGSTSPSPA